MAAAQTAKHSKKARKPSFETLKEHIKRLEKMRKYADLHGDRGSLRNGK